MTRTRRSLRALSALCLALLFYAATPHVHGSAHGAERTTAAVAEPTQPLHPGGSADRIAGLRDPATPSQSEPWSAAELSSDDAHESHRLTQTGDGHPCTLCRNGGQRAAAHVAPLAPRLAAVCAPRIDTARSERPQPAPLARRDAARAPPVA